MYSMFLDLLQEWKTGCVTLLNGSCGTASFLTFHSIDLQDVQLLIEAAIEANPETETTGMVDYAQMVTQFGDQDDTAWFSNAPEGGRENRS